MIHIAETVGLEVSFAFSVILWTLLLKTYLVYGRGGDERRVSERSLFSSSSGIVISERVTSLFVQSLPIVKNKRKRSTGLTCSRKKLVRAGRPMKPYLLSLQRAVGLWLTVWNLWKRIKLIWKFRQITCFGGGRDGCGYCVQPTNVIFIVIFEDLRHWA